MWRQTSHFGQHWHWLVAFLLLIHLWTNNDILPIWPLGTNSHENMKDVFIMSSAKYRTFYSGLNMLNPTSVVRIIPHVLWDGSRLSSRTHRPTCLLGPRISTRIGPCSCMLTIDLIIYIMRGHLVLIFTVPCSNYRGLAHVHVKLTENTNIVKLHVIIVNPRIVIVCRIPCIGSYFDSISFCNSFEG